MVSLRCVTLVHAHLRLTSAQYDIPVDNCACHIHYEVWIVQQYALSRWLTHEFPDELFKAEGSPVQDTALAAVRLCRNAPFAPYFNTMPFG